MSLRKLIPCLDNGHGGVINGVYQTAGKRSPKWSKGVLYEGMFNRWVVNRLVEKLDRENIPYYHVSSEYTDTTLYTRVNRLDKIYSKNRDTYGLSVHANGGGGQGVEGFTTPRRTRADPIGEMFLANIEKDFAGETRMRFDYSDGDRDKEARYYILRKAKMPMFLIECGFMDQKSDYNNLWDEDYLDIIVNSLFKTIKHIYRVGI